MRNNGKESILSEESQALKQPIKKEMAMNMNNVFTHKTYFLIFIV